ncbi:MAG: 50S ribosomal protein L6 [Alphaproteobacteria bacterium]|nr:50S ribosomal protein L6 [Alphaproteobacteria bacterium]
MSRIGKKPVPLPKGVTAKLEAGTVSVKGPKGELKLRLVPEVEAAVNDAAVAITPREESDRARAMWGMQRTLLNNIVRGVTEGFTEKLEISGVGYRAAVQGKNLQLQLGFSHDVLHPIPAGIQIVCEKPTAITITGIDKQLVGQVASEIRSYRKPEPYKGKGVRYAGERIRRKEGKKK